MTHIDCVIGATGSKIWQIRCFYPNEAEKDTIINDDEKFQLISVKTTNPPLTLQTSFDLSEAQKLSHTDRQRINILACAAQQAAPEKIDDKYSL